MTPFARASLIPHSLVGFVAWTAMLACSPDADSDDTMTSGTGGTVGSGGGLSTGGTTLGSGGLGSGGLGSGGGSTGGAGASGGATTGGSDSGGSSAGGMASGGSDAGGSPGTGGEGTGGSASLVEPIERAADSYVLEFSQTLFEVDPTQGARIVTFSHGGTNLLEPTVLVSTGTPFLNGGSTLWLSPQDAWEGGWPPQTAIDSDPFMVTLDGSAIVTNGSPATFPSGAQFSVSKRFAADLAAEGIDITYGVKNEGTAAASCGLWEVSRHGRGGLTFWPGSEVETGEFALGAPQEGVLWWDDSSSTATGKVFSDGSEGWVAHVDGNLLLVKTWTDHASLAPAHGEIELYLGDGYIEIEEHGAYGELAPSAEKTWDISWYVRMLDSSVDVSPGSAALLEMARALAN